MKNHLSQDQLNILKQCVNAYEECITQCQNLISSCAADKADMCLMPCNNTDIQDCATHCGKTVAASHKVIVTCEKAIDICQEHLKSCDDKNCAKKCNDLILKNKESINLAMANEKLCSVGNAKCVDSCLRFIEIAASAVEACLKHVN